MWGKGTTARDKALSALVCEAQAVGVPEDVILYLENGRGEKALEVLQQLQPAADGLATLVSKVEAAMSDQ